MSIFNGAVKIAKNELLESARVFRKKRVTRQERIEVGRYKKLKESAKKRRITLSKMLDAVIDHFIEDNPL